MNKLIKILIIAAVLISFTSAQADWQRSPASDVDKEFISGNPGLAAGVPGTDNSCWLAAASNLLAGAGYGNGATIQARAEDIYLDMLVWQRSLDAANTHGTRDGGWIDTACTWWLGSGNNVWPTNPYTVVTVYGNKSKVPWANSNGAKYIGNQLRNYNQVGLSISIPRTSANGSPSGGHAIAAWGDDGTVAILSTNPDEVIVADSDRDGGGDFQTYTYDSYTNPNPGGFDEGNGWYFNFAANHWFIKHICTLTPIDNAIDPGDGPTQLVMGSYKIPQEELEPATDLHYTAWTDYDILAYKTEIDWSTNNDPAISESNTHRPNLTRSDIHVDWDLTDNPVPFGNDVTITTEFILKNWNGLWYDDVYFTYPDGQRTKYAQPPDMSGWGGLDVRVDSNDGRERILADDFPCTETGPITKIYLFNSWVYDSPKNPPPEKINNVHLAIYSDDPVGDDPENKEDDPTNLTSKPLELLWEMDFDEFQQTVVPGLQGYETFWDPFIQNDPLQTDQRVWMYRFDIPKEQAFIQRGSKRYPKVYWLAVSADIEGIRKEMGWHNTSVNNGWNDAAVAWKDTFVLTDRFDYGDDFKTHEYKEAGSVSPGSPAYACDTAALRIGSADSGARVQITVDVIPGTDQVKLRYRVPWSGRIAGTTPSGAALYVDDVRQGSIVGDIENGSCEWREMILSKMAFYTADGKLDILLVDEIKEPYDGDIQITFMEVYSKKKDWVPLYYPDGVEMQGYKLDLAFGIVTDAPRNGFRLPEFGWNIQTEELENPDIVDITGGYVIGSFEIFNEIGPTTPLGEYRFVHQYPHTQDPEKHKFTIQGPEDQTGCEYRAANFKFGHLYGKPTAQELWQFNDWMSKPVLDVWLCNPDPKQVELNWEGRLPYPPSDIIPAHKLPPSPDCTTYLEGDINEDCCVDLEDFSIVSRDWMQCTLIN